MNDTDDLFDDEPKPNSPEDLGGWVPRGEKVKPWDPKHPDHPAQRPENQLEDGEEPPSSWNVATTDLGIQHMRLFLGWCEDKGIDSRGFTVGQLYVGLNAHSLDGMRWLMTSLRRVKFERLPSIVAMSKAISARDVSFWYREGEPDDQE